MPHGPRRSDIDLRAQRAVSRSITMCETGCARVGSGGGAGPRPLAGKGQKRKRARQWERKGRGREGGEGLEEGSQYLKAVAAAMIARLCGPKRTAYAHSLRKRRIVFDRARDALSDDIRNP